MSYWVVDFRCGKHSSAVVSAGDKLGAIAKKGGGVIPRAKFMLPIADANILVVGPNKSAVAR
jgi:hypothetical protein